MLPRLIINYKTYDRGIGKKAIELSNYAKEVINEYKVSIAVMPTFVDLKENSKIVDCYAQTLEPFEGGAHTGHITLNQVLEANAKGVVLNHSEKRMNFEAIKKASAMSKEYGLDVIVCVENSREAKELDDVESIDALALEPRELIGSGKAVSKEKPGEIKKAIEEIKKPLYVGAGITSKEDVEKSIELGAYGILVASAIVKAPNQKKKIEELISPFC